MAKRGLTDEIHGALELPGAGFVRGISGGLLQLSAARNKLFVHQVHRNHIGDLWPAQLLFQFIAELSVLRENLLQSINHTLIVVDRVGFSHRSRTSGSSLSPNAPNELRVPDRVA
jgi:hypothetical protein